MKNFTYHQPATVELALPLLEDQWGKCELLAGGTDLHDLQKEYVAQPEKVVSLTGIKGEFREIQAIGPPVAIEAVTIGAGVKLADIADSKLLGGFPALATAAGMIAGPQIRNMGTLGGSLCQRNRCWYFRDEHVNCLLKGGRKCFAQEGENQYHAIFTQGHPCVIVHPSTLAPPLIALGATATIVGPKGKREIPVEKLFRAPVKATEREHVLAPNEILVSVKIAPPGGRWPSNASYEVKQRETNEWPLVQAVATFTLDGKVAKNARVVLGHVAPTPLVSEAAAKALEGKEVTEATAEAAGKAACEGARPLGQNEYKVQLLAIAVKRAVLTAAGAKKYWEG
ncbi:MAG TPA: xanthine dehydrogenase family protein subunit M [Gemmataceae bacterium]|nr:xanthine dehydrogenase family protein subunit M [Gemmataceae bacterium]